MSSAGILLRVLLALSLILNAIGGVLAGSEMSSHEAMAASMPAGCHDQSAAGALPDPGDAPVAPTDDGDCCDSGVCVCACAQLPSLAANESLFSPPRLEHALLASRFAPARAAPALPHLIRPPIA